MCKVLMVPGIKKKHQDKVKKLLEAAAVILSNHDEDGVGYAAITKEGKVFGEKWLNKGDAFKVHAQPKPTLSEMVVDELLGTVAKWKKKPSSEKVYDSFGDLSHENREKAVSVILHARKATIGSKSIENVHPFIELMNPDEKDGPEQDTALIHNGSIVNHLALTKKMSSCDSEVLLHEYLKNQMNYNPWGVDDLAKAVRGEYTVGVLSSYTDRGGIVPILDIFKSNKYLSMAYCPDIETVVFATFDHLFNDLAKETNFKFESIVELEDGWFLRVDAITGKRMEDPIKFTPSSTTFGTYNDEKKSSTNTNGGNKEDDKSYSEHDGGVIDMTGKRLEDVVEETINDVKKNFESAHSELFTQKYETPAGLTEAETAFLDTLSKAKNTDMRAFKLVQKAMGVI